MAKRRRNESKQNATRRSADASSTRMPELRRKIDALDERLVELLNQRADLAKEIGALKAVVGAQAYAPAREMDVYRRVFAMNKGPLSDEALRAVYREVMSAAIALEQPIRVMYFGQPGSFTHAAARDKFGAMVEYEAAADPRDAALAAERGRADYAVLPVENSTEGGVSQTLDLLLETRLRIISEIYLPIHLHLLSREPLSRIRTVYSHPQPFSQARRWLSTNLGAATQEVCLSTAAAAELAAKTPRSAAIGGLQAAELYGLSVCARNIEDRSDNITRFIVLGDAVVPPSGCDKTSIAVAAKNESGALFKLLRPFEEKGVSMTRIESRPNRRKAWEYVFFVDFEGHVEDWRVKEALKEMRALSRHMEVLGSYPRADHVRGFAKRQIATIRKKG